MTSVEVQQNLPEEESATCKGFWTLLLNFTRGFTVQKCRRFACKQSKGKLGAPTAKLSVEYGPQCANFDNSPQRESLGPGYRQYERWDEGRSGARSSAH